MRNILTRSRPLFSSFTRDQRGATAIEYSLIAAVIAFGIVAVSNEISEGIANPFATLDRAFKNEAQGEETVGITNKLISEPEDGPVITMDGEKVEGLTLTTRTVSEEAFDAPLRGTGE